MNETDESQIVEVAHRSRTSLSLTSKNNIRSKKPTNAGTHAQRSGKSGGKVRTRSSVKRQRSAQVQVITPKITLEQEKVAPADVKNDVMTNAVAAQLTMPNPNIPCTPGWCLVYVRETFGIGPKYPSATAGWNASSHKHTDQNFPADVWVPIWFSLNNNPDGHVALRQPDGSIWSSSSPTSTTPVHHPSLQDLMSYYGNKLTYLGWTEDVEDVLIMNGTVQATSQLEQQVMAVRPVLAKPATPVDI